MENQFIINTKQNEFKTLKINYLLIKDKFFFVLKITVNNGHETLFQHILLS